MSSHTLSHIAGPSITVDGRILQRCLVCGAKLCDSLGTMMPLEKDGSPPLFPVFPKGRFVRVTTGIPGVTEHLVLEDSEKLPPDTCLDTI